MVTSTKKTRWPGDVPIPAGNAGLQTDSFVRLELFTLENALIHRRLGSLGLALMSGVERTLRHELL